MPPGCSLDSISSLRRTAGRPGVRHSSIDACQRRASPEDVAILLDTADSADASSRRPAGFRIRIRPSLPTTSSPDDRLSTISLLRRSEASARADISRSCAFSLVSASCSAAVTNAVSDRFSRQVAFRIACRGREAQHGEDQDADQSRHDSGEPDERVGRGIHVESSIERGVPRHDLIADDARHERADGEKRAERQRVFHVASLERDDAQPDRPSRGTTTSTSVRSISFQPRNAPIIASILTSPNPMPSSPRMRK